jgi:imidazolonepropionase-like amidohydrolase
MRSLCFFALLLASLGAHAQITPFAPPIAGSIVIYRGATLVDGTGGPPRPDMAIVTDGQIIKAVLPSRELPANTVGEIVEMGGRYVVPGLIDAHVHLRMPDRKIGEAILKRDIYSGITAVRDMADDLDALRVLARDAREGKVIAPDIYMAALVAGPSFFTNRKTQPLWGKGEPGSEAWAQRVTDQTDLVRAIERARGTGAVAIKVYSDLSGPLVAKIVAEAHRQGMLTWAHAAVFPATPKDVIDAGIDSVSHVCHLAYQASDKFPQTNEEKGAVQAEKFANGNATVQALFREMQLRGTILDATLVTYVRSGFSLTGPYCTEELAARLVGEAHRAGVPIAAGTDRYRGPDIPFSPLHEEIALLVEKAGLTPAEAIRSATAISAAAAGQQAQMGTIEPGKLANLVFLTKDPLADINNLKSLVLTVKRGTRFPRADFRAGEK